MQKTPITKIYSLRTMTKDSQVFRQNILGARRSSNYLLATAATIGGVGFLLAGLSSYLKVNLLVVTDTTGFQFIPQGAALCFYGVCGTLLAVYTWLLIALDVGSGYNEFDKKNNRATIARSGFIGKNRRLAVDFPLEDVQSIRAEIKEGLSPKRALYLKVKKRRDIPLTRVGTPMAIAELENQGAELARFLQVPLEGL
jgi:hypothetical protein